MTFTRTRRLAFDLVALLAGRRPTPVAVAD